MKIEEVREYMRDCKRKTANAAPNQVMYRKKLIIDNALKKFPELTREEAEEIFMNRL